MTKPLLLIACTTLAFCCSAPHENPPALAIRMDSLLALHSKFSGVVLAADSGTILFHRAKGFRDYGSKEPLDTLDIFELASVSKQFTSMAIMRLKEEGKLSYNDPLEKFIPELPYPGITVRHLLTHTSGLPDYQAIMDQHWDKSKVAGNREVIEYLKLYHPPALFEPGAKYEYSNTGYLLLASIVEAASGQDFVDFCRQWIFDPLGMTSTAIRSNEQKHALTNLALGHIYVENKNQFVHADSFPSSNYTIWLGARKGPGRVSSTAIDLFKWDQALYANKMVSAATLEEAFTPATLNDGTQTEYGFGWEIKTSPQHGKVAYHTGDNPGYRTIILRYPDQRKTLIILNNNDYEGIEQIREEFEKLLLKRR